MMDRMQKLTEAIRMLIVNEFSGHIKINFSQGSIGRVEKSEELEDAALFFAGEQENGKERGEKDFSDVNKY
jgi:hypothetical protein